MTTIKGSGGGGKSGGGSARVAQEAADSLQSKQLAKVVDLISEGEIKGLVNGLQSVYLNDTPIQNSDGSLNVSGVGIDTRNGTQSQSFIKGFSAVESEKAVGVAVKNGTPITRTITGSEFDAVRVTLSLPRLTRQNTTNGDVTGTSVEVGIEIQTDGGGFVPVRLRHVTENLADESGILSSVDKDVISASITINWTGVAQGQFEVKYLQTASYQVNYRVVGDVSWIPLSSGSFSGVSKKEKVASDWLVPYRYQSVPPKDAKTVLFSAPSEAAYEFQVTFTGTGSIAKSGTFVTYSNTDVISGKTSSKYQRAYRIPLPTGTSHDVRVTRITADSTSQALQNETYWDSYTEIVDAKFSYPNSALVAMSVDSSLYTTIPTRGYEIEGIIVRIPSNYDPVERTYTGIWDGTFTTDYTNNPAWVFYDLIVESRYGLGDFVSESMVDKWTLYEIAQYCDELIDDGQGGLEPRFTCNVYIQTREEAYKLLMALSSSFMAMSYWSSGAVTLSQDSPKEPVALFTPANVVGGAFNYSGSSQRTRATAVAVTWNNPDDLYKASIEYVSDEEAIARYGVNQKDVVAFGCTSRGQAHRFGRAILFTEKMETEIVTFRCGLDGINVNIGEVIQTTDPVRAGQRMGGRLSTGSTTTTLNLDQSVTIESGKTYTAWAVLPDGSVESKTVTNGVGDTSSLTLDSALSDTPLDYSIWVLGVSDLVPEQWRIVSVEEDGFEATITALEYRSDKYSAIEDGIDLVDLPISSINPKPTKPTNLEASEQLYLITNSLVGTRLTVSWVGKDPSYEVQYKKDDGNWIIVTTQNNSIDIEPVQAGNYEIKVSSIGQLGAKSLPTTITQPVYGLTTPPADVSGLSLQAIAGNAILTWDKSTDLDVLIGGKILIKHTSALTSPSWSDGIDIGGEISGSSTTATLPLLSGSYMAKWVDSSGNKSESSIHISTTAPSVINLNIVETITESPSFTGLKTGVIVEDNLLKLDSAETIDEQTETIDTWEKLSMLGGVASSGEYIFSGSTDLGSIQTSRITANISSSGVDLSDTIDLRGLVSTWSSIDGGVIEDIDASIYLRQSDDNVTFGDWEKFSVGDYTARAFEFKLVLTSGAYSYNVLVDSLAVMVDMPDRIDSQEDILSGAGTKSITYSTDFIGVPSVGITAQDMQTGDYYSISNKGLTGFDIIFKDSSGTTISRTFDYIARGY